MTASLAHSSRARTRASLAVSLASTRCIASNCSCLPSAAPRTPAMTARVSTSWSSKPSRRPDITLSTPTGTRRWNSGTHTIDATPTRAQASAFTRGSRLASSQRRTSAWLTQRPDRLAARGSRVPRCAAYERVTHR
jgi:hypothetical protein